MSKFLLILLFLSARCFAQSNDCRLLPPALRIDFGTGYIDDLGSGSGYAYRRVMGSCPSDGHYSYTSSTSDCFRGDWQTVPEDHTPGDKGGNMMIVNASYRNGYFLVTPIGGLKPKTKYRLSVWMMNVCRLTEKCPFPLLPDISVKIRSGSGAVVAGFETGEVRRLAQPKWEQYSFMFTTPAITDDLFLTMIDNNPGGCGNDFVLDDIEFSECVPLKSPTKAVLKAKPKISTPATTKKAANPITKSAPNRPASGKQSVVKTSAPRTPKQPVQQPISTKAVPTAQRIPKDDSLTKKSESVKSTLETEKTQVKPVVTNATALPPPPPVITRRTNEIYKRIETQPGQIRIDLYDNGEIDGDTVTIYHNNRLIVSKARLTAQPITVRIQINPEEPYHEVVMVANNLGSIPPNTSLMVVTAGTERHEVYTSSTEKKNAKVIFQLKQ